MKEIEKSMKVRFEALTSNGTKKKMKNKFT